MEMVRHHEAEVFPVEGPCGVSETMFPRMGKCCEAKAGIFGTEYNGSCPYCSVLKLPIDSSSLEIVTLFECTRCGYGKRVKGSTLLR